MIATDKQITLRRPKLDFAGRMDRVEQLESFAPQRARLKAAAAEALRPRPRVQTSQWVAENIKLNTDYEGSAGPVDFSRRPYWREVLDSFDDPEVDTIALPASTQVGKTLMMLCAALSLAENQPAPAMLVTPDQVSCIELRDRLYRLASDCRVFRDRIPKEREWNTRHVDLGKCRIYLAYAGARQRLRGRPARVVNLNEVDVYRGDSKGGDPIAAAGERVKSFSRSKIIMESSPGDDPSPVFKAYEQSDARKWHCKCPHCGTYQELRFFTYKTGEKKDCGGISGYLDDEGKVADEDLARAQAHYVCITGCRIEQADKDDFLCSGIWVPRGQSVNKAGKLVGKPERSGRRRGYHLWTIFSPMRSFADIAAAYVAHYVAGNLPDFIKNWLGLAYSPKTKMPEYSVLGRRNAFHHKRGTVPKDVWFLTAGMDVQEDRVYWAVRGWGDLVTSWLIDWGIFERSSTEEDTISLKSDLAQIQNRILMHRWPVEQGLQNPLGKSSLGILLAGIDSNYRSLDVHEWIRSLSPAAAAKVRALRGDHQLDPRVMYRPNILDENRRGDVEYTGGLEQWGVSVNIFKQDLAQRFTAPRGPGAFYFPNSILLSAEGINYLKQLVNEPCIAEKNDAGKIVYRWKEKNHMIGHDFWDCEVYNRAIAQMIVDALDDSPGWNARKWPKATVLERQKMAADAASHQPQVNVVARDGW